MNLQIANLYYNLFNMQRGSRYDVHLVNATDVALLQLLLDEANASDKVLIDAFSLEKDFGIGANGNFPYFQKSVTRYLIGARSTSNTFMTIFQNMKRAGISIRGEMEDSVSYSTYQQFFNRMRTHANLSAKKKDFFMKNGVDDPISDSYSATVALTYAYLNGKPRRGAFSFNMVDIIGILFPLVVGEPTVRIHNFRSWEGLTMAWMIKTFSGVDVTNLLSEQKFVPESEYKSMQNHIKQRLSYTYANSETLSHILTSAQPISQSFVNLCIFLSMYSSRLQGSYIENYLGKIIMEAIINYVTHDVDEANTFTFYDIMVSAFGAYTCNVAKGPLLDIICTIQSCTQTNSVLATPNTNPISMYRNGSWYYGSILSKVDVDTQAYEKIKKNIHLRNNSNNLDYRGIDANPETTLLEVNYPGSILNELITESNRYLKYNLNNARLAAVYNRCDPQDEKDMCTIMLAVMAEVQIFIFGNTRIDIRQITGITDVSTINLAALRRDAEHDLCKIHLSRYKE